MLQYVSQVFEDVILKLQYFINDTEYCDKPYMNINNIPELLKLYKKFYENQVATNLKGFNNQISNISATISISQYISEFNSVYSSSSTSTPYLVQTILLNGVSGADAILQFSSNNSWNSSNTITSITYNYFYINTNNPSAVQIYNNYSNITTTYTTVADFISDYNTYFKSSVGTYSVNEINTYLNGGFYPGGGTINYSSSSLPYSQNVGYVYSYSNISDNVQKYLIYETIETTAPYTYGSESSGIGVALIYYINYNI